MLMNRTFLSLGKREESTASFNAFLIGSSNAEKRKRLKKLLETGIKSELTERQKTCIMRYYAENTPAEEIAKELGITKATVYKHIRSGRKRLKKCVDYL